MNTIFSLSRVQEAGASVLKHRENKGKGEALRTGFKLALGLSADVIVTLDVALKRPTTKTAITSLLSFIDAILQPQ